jgi:hypothetical protein
MTAEDVIYQTISRILVEKLLMEIKCFLNVK